MEGITSSVIQSKISLTKSSSHIFNINFRKPLSVKNLVLP